MAAGSQTIHGQPGRYNSSLPTLNAGQGAALAVDSSGRLITSPTSGGETVTGNVASGATDSGNPVKIGGVFNTTQPTVTNGQRVDSQATARGSLLISAGVDGSIINGTNSTGTNILAVGNVSQ